ncbi:MAG: PMT family glycosyltransferase, 4-amino-4-deoxy-L-arabinose transferase [Parcubacteria group bacterium Gr01-1014_31]|nr:MAG: PMT family glycosyltransferase, 4-amino-4-deoxy-L-arabinose transferase [Parcubacteria group bacterium Gr01-1014_31]
MKSTFRIRREHLVLLVIAVIAGGLIFFRLNRADVQTDAGHYALRALGYFDFLDSARQTTPLQWFAPIAPPLWTKFSMHDHPPLVFLIQHAFFRLLGESDVVALLPFALAGVWSVLLIYGIGRRCGGPAMGLLAAALLSVSTFFTWSSRIGYLEGVTQAFILLAVWLWLKAESDSRFLPVWGAGLALAILSKYSALILIPVFGALLLLRHRAWLSDRRFWLSLGVVVALLSPVVTYNWQMWLARGHLDVQLTTLVPSSLEAASRDWPLLFDGPRTRNIAVNLRDLGLSLSKAFSPPFVLLLAAGLAFSAWSVVRGSRRNRDLLPLFTLVSATAFFALTAPSLRYLPILVPWLVLPSAAALAAIARWNSGSRKNAALAIIVLAAVAAGVELLFNWNTNLVLAAYGTRGRHFAAYRQERLGFQELVAYLLPKLAQSPTYRPAVRSFATYEEWQNIHLTAGEDVLLYDDGLTWFSAFWYLRRYRVYHDVDALLLPTDVVVGLGEDWLPRLARAGIRTAYVVIGNNPRVYDPWAAQEGEQLASKKIGAGLQRMLDGGAPGRVTEIVAADGQPAFKVYELFLNPAGEGQPKVTTTPSSL